MVMVSVVTPCHNSSDFIAETIQSVLDQSFLDWELILVDDYSSDSTCDLIREFIAEDARIQLIQLPTNQGAAVARNAAIKIARGRYISFLDSDDIWMADKLEKQLNFMQSGGYPFTYTAYDKIDENGLKFGHVGVPKKVSYYDLLKMCSVGCLTAIYDAEYFGKVYMPLIRKRQDLGLWLKLLKVSTYAYGLNVSLARYRVRKQSISANKFSAAKYTWRLYREVERLNFFAAFYFFLHYAVRGLLRTKAPIIARLFGIL